MSRFIDTIKNLVLSERSRDYNHPLPNHLDIAIRWSLRFLSDGFVISAYDVAYMMDDLKTSRDSHTPKMDNLDDKGGYMLCIDQMYEELIRLKIAEDYDDAMFILSKRDINYMTWLLNEWYKDKRERK